MRKKLTPSMSEEARQLAAEENTSVSAMLEQVIHGMAAQSKRNIPITPEVKKLTGIIKIPTGKSDRELITEALVEKHGFKEVNVMIKKLTLSMEEDVIDQAKKLAAQENTSVSSMFARFIRGKTEYKKRDFPISPAVRKISGIAKLPKGKTYQDILTEALMEKYGLDK